LPDHSSLTRIRQRLGIDVVQRFFEKSDLIADEIDDAALQADIPLPPSIVPPIDP
jgi:hypothetical protein